MTSTGYCPHCQQNVLMRREEMNIALAIILLCFTGIGFFIYLIYYFSKPENYCVHCSSICQATLPSAAPQTTHQMQYQARSNTQNVQSVKNHLNFCPFCGNILNEGTKNFCPSCGSKL